MRGEKIMRIISSWRDFYDSVQRQGMDKDVMYVREQRDILINGDFEVYSRKSSDYTIELMFLGFCGQIYKLSLVYTNNHDYEKTYYDFEEFKTETLAMGITHKYEFGRRF